MTLWFFENIPDFKAEKRFRVQFPVSTGERTFTHLWEITEVIPLKRITYHWSYEEYDGEGTVIFELKGIPEGSQLTVSALGMDSFPQDIPEFKRESCQGGWDYFIKERLAAYLKD
ncbi:MAG: hypothetical protein Aureis2KO_00190 [Aureisphaera sp.]